MAMKTASPWWVSLVLWIGVLFFIISERLFGHLQDSTAASVRMALTALSLGAIVATAVARAWTTMASHGSRRKLERALLLCHLGTLVSLAIYAISTNWGLSHFTMAEKTAERVATMLTVVYSIVMAASIVPLLMIEQPLGVARRTAFDVHSVDEDASVELYRVRELGWSGLSIALAAAFLMTTCAVANQRNVQKDVSFFKTSSPGESSRNIVAASSEPIKVLLFFPDPNEVKDQVRDYFESLASSGKLTIEEHDKLLDSELASKYKVPSREDPDHPKGTVVLARGTGDKEKSFTIEIEAELDKARRTTGKLRTLDKEVNQVLMKLARDKRKAYLMVGHGEMTNPESIPPEMKSRVPERRTSVFKKRLAELNYEVKDLGAIDLIRDVPDDATVVILLAPSIPLQTTEWQALDRYLQRGGRLMIALDPKGDPSLGVLENRLGLHYLPADLTDEQNFYPQRGNAADRRFVFTTQFSAHASTTALSRAAEKSGLVLVDSGALADAPFKVTGETPKKTVTIRSMDTSFLDYNDNFKFDGDTKVQLPWMTAPEAEKKQKWNIGVAVEGPKLKDNAGKDKDGFRALVYADVDLFADAMVQSGGRVGVILLSGPLLDDSIRWLGGEEVFAGEIVTEEDKPIKHTKSQDALWFTLSIAAVPLLVLGLGLYLTMVRKRKKTEVTP